MKLSPTRKKLNILFGGLVLAFLVYIFWPSVTSPIRLWLYCTNIAAGESALTAIDQAKGNAFHVAALSSNIYRVYEMASLGRVGCLISTDDTGAVITAEMELSD